MEAGPSSQPSHPKAAVRNGADSFGVSDRLAPIGHSRSVPVRSSSVHTRSKTLPTAGDLSLVTAEAGRLLTLARKAVAR
jgi:hypothetical protein